MVKEQNKKLPIIILTVVAFLAAAVGGYFCLSFFQSKTPSNSSITAIEDDGSESGTVDASLTYSGYATLNNEDKLITLNFINPKKAKKTLSLEIVANIDGEDIVLAKTDKIAPGHKIDSVKYELDKEIQKGNYKGNFIVYFYNEKGEEEIVNTKININVYVK